MHNELLHGWRLFLLLLISSLGSVLAVLFTPALPSIQHIFEVSVGTTQNTMTTYLIGYAVGMLVYGPLANRFGRKISLFFGLSLSFLTTILSLYLGVDQPFWLLFLAIPPSVRSCECNLYYLNNDC